MKTIGYTLIICSLIIGFLTESLPKDFPIEPLVALAFCVFILGIYTLICSKEEKGSVPKIQNPPAPPERGIRILGENSSRKNEDFSKMMEELKQTNPADFRAQIEGNFSLIGSTKKKCICNDISKHSPAGRCEACLNKWSKVHDAYPFPQLSKDKKG